MLVFACQALLYVLRERGRLWDSRPGLPIMAFSVADIVAVSVLATRGIAMDALPLRVVLALLGATLVFALLLDQVKVVLFRYLPVD
jgi:H+-transporting ATPase